MSYKIKRVEVWAADILNRPGTLARVLEALAAAGGQLEFMIARRVTDQTSRVFVAPISSAKVKRAASDVGLIKAAGLHAIRIEGPDRPGLGSAMTRAVGAAGINLRGASAAGIGKKVLFYLAVATDKDANAAAAAIRKALAGKRRA